MVIGLVKVSNPDSWWQGLEEFQFQDLRVGAGKGYPNDLGTALTVLFNFHDLETWEDHSNDYLSSSFV